MTVPCFALAPALVRRAFHFSENFKQPCGSHSATDTHCADDIACAAALPFDQSVAHHARTGHAIGMPHLDRSAIDVENFVRDPQMVAAGDHLTGEGFVQLPQADILDLQAVRL